MFLLLEPNDFLETTTLGTRSNVSKYKVDCAKENKPG